MADSAVHYLLIGHITKDLTPQGPLLGGTPSFAALTAQALDYTPGIVTAAHDDVDLTRLAGISLACQPADETTTFENIYRGGGRQQFLRGRAGPLTVEAVPTRWLRAPIVHLAPMAQELDPALAGDFNGSFIGLTPQGWLREWGADGQVRTEAAKWPQAAEVLSRVSATVTSVDDLNGDWAVAERWARWAAVLVVTRGAAGCTVFVKGEGAREFLAPSVVEVDPTGAGDVFAAAYFVNLYETGDPWASARFANQVAALSVTRVGLDGTPTREEAGYCRARAALG
jgi:hypothetical protein